MSTGFCGNPFNHDAHQTEFENRDNFWCEGVGREEVKEEIVEKYEPLTKESDMAEDGTPYKKVTILIEDLKTGETSIICAPKASYPHMEIYNRPFVDLERPNANVDPELEKAIFQFTPHTEDETPAVSVQVIKKENTDG